MKYLPFFVQIFPSGVQVIYLLLTELPDTITLNVQQGTWLIGLDFLANSEHWRRLISRHGGKKGHQCCGGPRLVHYPTRKSYTAKDTWSCNDWCICPETSNVLASTSYSSIPCLAQMGIPMTAVLQVGKMQLDLNLLLQGAGLSFNMVKWIPQRPATSLKLGCRSRFVLILFGLYLKQWLSG